MDTQKTMVTTNKTREFISIVTVKSIVSHGNSQLKGHWVTMDTQYHHGNNEV